jgi:hypothetical protein
VILLGEKKGFWSVAPDNRVETVAARDGLLPIPRDVYTMSFYEYLRNSADMALHAENAALLK